MSDSSDSDTTWVWWLLLILLVAAVVGWILWAVARRRRWAAWREAAAPVAAQTLVVHDLLPAGAQQIDDLAHWQEVREQAEQNAQRLDAVAASGPSREATETAQAVARGVRDLTAGLEAERLLVTAPRPPTAEALGQAESATRAARAELEAAQVRLDALIGPPPAGAAGPTSAGPAPPPPA